ncbi:hypothetical protein [Xanthomonas phage RTH11]|nr:hypothetical protein [Xanthomonas phage RTH11]
MQIYRQMFHEFLIESNDQWTCEFRLVTEETLELFEGVILIGTAQTCTLGFSRQEVR